MALHITSTDIDCEKLSLASIETLRGRFPSENDETLARFLIARKGDVDKASDMLAKHLSWRSETFPIYKESCIGELRKNKCHIHGTDREGHPLFVWKSKNHIGRDRDIGELTRMIVWWIEVAIKQLPADKSKFSILLDRSDFKQENGDIEFIKVVAGVFQDNYPERSHRIIVHPTGLVFFGLWNVVKWFLDPVTQAKVQPMLQVSGVHEFIDPVFLPATMGGGSDFMPNIDEIDDPFPPITRSEEEEVSTEASTPST